VDEWLDDPPGIGALSTTSLLHSHSTASVDTLCG
jgi:hypothetical protein